jgi:hypothetical protein
MERTRLVPLVVVIAIALLAGIAAAAQFTVTTLVAPTAGNGTWLAVNYLQMNVTLNQSAANVTFILNQTYYITGLGTGTGWGANFTGFGESNYDATSSMNVTVNVERGGVNETNITGYVWWVDTTTPTIGNNTDTPTITNASGGDRVFLTSAVVDNSTDSCWYNIYFKQNQAQTNTFLRRLDGTISSTTTRTPTCNLTIDNGNFTVDGYYEISVAVNDSAGNIGWSTTNETVIATILKANQWNLIAALEEDANISNDRGTNFYQWARNHSTVSYMSTFNESAQGFITYQKGTAANNETVIEMGDAIYIYPSADMVLIRDNRTILSTYENVTFINSSLYGPWTLVGMMYYDYNMSELSNATLYTNWVSYHNSSDDYHYTYVRNFGPDYFNETYVIQGLGVWMDSNRSDSVIWSRRLDLSW